MPRYPSAARSMESIPGAVYSALAHRLATHPGEVYPLHVGDTWLEPAEGCRMEDLTVADLPGMHRYAPPQGRPGLIRAIADRTTQRTGVPTTPEDILVVGGATGGLGAVLGSILDPGEEVLILGPHWPLITGIARCFHGVPVVVPFIGVATDPESAVEVVEAHRTERTAAIYVSTPNNPTGKRIPAAWLASLAEWARRHDLWIVADEVYEETTFDGPHDYLRPMAPERTFSAHSFSKAFGMAGNRCGWVIGPPGRTGDLTKISTHSFYSANTAAQIAGERVLDGRGDAWIADVLPRYRAAGQAAAERLGVEAPSGSTFLFLDVADHLDERGLVGFLEDCADGGLFVAPGPSFGPYPTHVRICFTAAAPDVVARGVEVLAQRLGR